MFKMTPNVLKNLFSPTSTRRYPRVQRAPFDNVRGALLNDIQQCTFCNVCAVKCPSQCITVDKTTGTWRYDPFACVFCGICVTACSAKCLQQQPVYRAAVTQREMMVLTGEPRKKSDSGE